MPLFVLFTVKELPNMDRAASVTDNMEDRVFSSLAIKTMAHWVQELLWWGSEARDSW